jgi:hypothetical protein
MSYIGPRRALLAPPIDPDALKWRAAVIAAGGPVSDVQKRRVSTLIHSLKASGVWSSLGRLWLHASENPTQATIDLVARASATLVNSPTFTAARGYQGRGYINTNFNPGIGTPKFTQNSGGYGCWVETADTTFGDRLMGNDSTAASEFFITAAVNYGYGVSQGANSASAIPASTTGAMDSVRVAASGAGAVNFYANGTLSASDTVASIAVPNQPFFVIASNHNNGTPPTSTIRAADCWIGGGMNATQIAAFKAARRAYMTAVGVA